ncbi:MAG: hypothetical protein QXI38_04620 [Conexivisphaerales archaeon]
MSDIYARDSDSVIRVLMTASMTRWHGLWLCGQTIRNNLKDPDVLSLNDDVVKDIKKMGTLKETHGCRRLA